MAIFMHDKRLQAEETMIFMAGMTGWITFGPLLAILVYELFDPGAQAVTIAYFSGWLAIPAFAAASALVKTILWRRSRPQAG